MRGSPLLRAFLVLVALLGLGWPLHLLLRPAEARPAATQAAIPPSQMAEVTVSLSFTTVPTAFALESLGQPLWQEPAPQAEMSRAVRVAFPKEGIELHFACKWPEGTRAAAQVRVTAPDGAEYTRYLWGEGETSDVLTFP